MLKLPPNTEGVIFDLDGTLLDSMLMWKDIDRDYLGGFGIPCPPDLQLMIEGMSVPQTAAFFKEHFGLADSIEQIMEDWNRMAYDFYCSRLKLKEGAFAYLQLLKEQGMKLGLGTSNYRNLTDECLKAHGIGGMFDAVCTSEDVRNGKPDPEIYLKAAAKMGVAPENCAVFEDLPAGILAAKNAGMFAVGVYDFCSVKVDDKKHALSDLYVTSLTELLPEA